MSHSLIETKEFFSNDLKLYGKQEIPRNSYFGTNRLFSLSAYILLLLLFLLLLSLQLPISANITHLQMMQKKLGLNITSAKKVYNEFKLLVCRIIKTSSHLEARKLYEIASTKHVNSDSIINKIFTVDTSKNKVIKNCRKIFNKNNNEKIWDNFMQLKEQSNITQSITIRSSSKKYPGGTDLSKILQSTYITFVENIQSRVQQTVQILKVVKYQKTTFANFVTLPKPNHTYSTTAN